MSEKFPATAIPETEEDGGPVQPADVQVVSGPVVKIEPPPPPDRMAGTEPKSSGRTNDEAFRA